MPFALPLFVGQLERSKALAGIVPGQMRKIGVPLALPVMFASQMTRCTGRASGTQSPNQTLTEPSSADASIPSGTNELTPVG